MRIGGIIVELVVPEMREGLAFYRELIGRPPDPGPDPDFIGWEIFENCWLQLREGPAGRGRLESERGGTHRDADTWARFLLRRE